MEKNIKIYSLIIAIIYLAVIVQNTYDGVSAAKSGFEMGWNESQNHITSQLFHFKVEPENGAFTYPQTIKNLLTGQNIQVEVGEYKIRMFESEDSETGLGFTIFRTFKFIFSFIMFGLIIYIPLLFFGIIKAVNKGEILTAKTIKKIRRIGWILLALFIYNTLVYSIGDAIAARQMIQLEGYRIVPDFSNFSSLFLCLVTLLLAEILKHTAKMKEEQELTI